MERRSALAAAVAALASLAWQCAGAGEPHPQSAPPTTTRAATATRDAAATAADHDAARPDERATAAGPAEDAGASGDGAAAAAAAAGASGGESAWALRAGTFPTRNDALAPGARAAFAFPVDVDSDGQRDEIVAVVPRDSRRGAQVVALAHASDAGWSLAPLFVGEAGRHEVSAVQAFIVRRVPFVLLEVRDRAPGGPDGGSSDRFAYLVLRYAPDAARAGDGGASADAGPGEGALRAAAGFVQVLALSTRDGAPVVFTAPAPDGTLVATAGRRQCTIAWNGTRMTATRWGGTEPPRPHAVTLELSRLP